MHVGDQRSDVGRVGAADQPGEAEVVHPALDLRAAVDRQQVGRLLLREAGGATLGRPVADRRRLPVGVKPERGLERDGRRRDREEVVEVGLARLR